jgi:hypothetical protein
MLNPSKLLILTGMFLFSTASLADFYSRDTVDEMDGDIRTKRYTFDIRQGTYHNFGFYCWQLSEDTKLLALTFDSDNYIARPIDKVYIEIKVDDGKIHALNGQMYGNSNKSGWVKEPSKNLLDELRNGNTALVSVYKHGLEMDGKFSLSGSKSAIDDVVGACS